MIEAKLIFVGLWVKFAAFDVGLYLVMIFFLWLMYRKQEGKRNFWDFLKIF